VDPFDAVVGSGDCIADDLHQAWGEQRRVDAGNPAESRHQEQRNTGIGGKTYYENEP
jgi:hypothetical protein